MQFTGTDLYNQDQAFKGGKTDNTYANVVA